MGTSNTAAAHNPSLKWGRGSKRVSGSWVIRWAALPRGGVDFHLVRSSGPLSSPVSEVVVWRNGVLKSRSKKTNRPRKLSVSAPLFVQQALVSLISEAELAAR